MKKILLTIILFSINSAWAEKKIYVCTAADTPTQIMYRGKLFSVSVEPTCIKLLNLEDKKLDWSWRVNLKNSLGDLEGSRHDCSKNDEGWIGNPAIWRLSEMKLIAFNAATKNYGFSASTFNCQINENK